MGQNNNENDSQKERSRVYVKAIQILFAVIIGVSFTSYFEVLVPFQNSFEQAMILVAFATVLASLVGYSITVGEKYHKKYYRFIIDLILLYIYFQLIFSPLQSFEYFLTLLPIIFVLYAAWEILEFVEWGGQIKKRLANSIGVTLGFVAIRVFYHFQEEKIQLISENISSLEYTNVGYNEWGILVVILGLVISYRYFVSKI